MKHGWTRMLSVLLAAALMLGFSLPETALAAGTYGRTTTSGVNVRIRPGGDYIFRVDQGTVVTVLDTTKSGGVTWYKVSLKKPGVENGNTYVGYIHGDYLQLLTAAEAVAWEQNPVNVPLNAASAAAANGATGVVTDGGVNFRSGPSLSSASMFKLDRGTVVELLSIPSAADQDPWYHVRYDGQTGYIQGPFIRVISSGTAATTSTAAASTAATTTTTTTAAVPTAVPAAQSATAVTAASGSGAYVKLMLSSADLCQSPGGAAVMQWTPIGSTLQIVGSSVVREGMTWYPVLYNSGVYYVAGSAVQLTNTPTSGATAAGAGTTAGTTAATATAAPAAQTGAGTVYYGYVRTTKKAVNLRLQPSGSVIQTVDKDVVFPVLSAPVSQDGYTWYYVQAGNVRGYLRGDCVATTDASGNAVAAAPTAAPAASAAASGSTGTYVTTVVDKVNLRKTPAGVSQEQVAIHVTLPVIGTPVASGNYTWYPVRNTDGVTGYLRSDCVTVTDASGAQTSAAAPAATATTTTPAAASGSYGSIRVTKKAVNVRKTPGGAVITRVDINTVWPLTGAAFSSGGYTWYPVTVNGTAAYIRGDCATPAAENGTAATPTAAPAAAAATGTNASYIKTTLDKVFIRSQASTASKPLTQVRTGTVLPCVGTQIVDGNLWYNVVWNGTNAFVLGSCAAPAAADGTATTPSAATTTAASTDPNSYVGYIKTIKGGVNVRKTPGGESLGQVKKGVVYGYSNAPTVQGSYSWYFVNTAFGWGYLRNDCVEICNADGSASANTAVSTGSQTTGTVVAPTEAKYGYLRLGSTGSDVTRLVNALIAQGYYSGAATDTYTAAVEDAVRKFQRAKGLTVDGIAGPNTQHQLYNTVPVGTTDANDLSMVLYPAEKIDWFTGGIQELWPRGANVKVYDVKTGIVWWAHRWAGSYHADIEPLTASDTARLCQIYGVSSAKQIASKNLWQRRPCLITIGNRTFACSLYGIPHNYGADTISNNNMTGQICLHFTNSKTHGSKKVDSYHTEAINYAWLNAPNGHK